MTNYNFQEQFATSAKILDTQDGFFKQFDKIGVYPKLRGVFTINNGRYFEISKEDDLIGIQDKTHEINEERNKFYDQLDIVERVKKLTSGDVMLRAGATRELYQEGELKDYLDIDPLKNIPLVKSTFIMERGNERFSVDYSINELPPDFVPSDIDISPIYDDYDHEIRNWNLGLRQHYQTDKRLNLDSLEEGVSELAHKIGAEKYWPVVMQLKAPVSDITIKNHIEQLSISYEGELQFKIFFCIKV